VIELVTSGQGYTILPQLAAEAIARRKYAGKVVEITRPAPAREISLVFRRGHLKQGLISSLRTVLDLAIPKSLPREKSKSFRVISLDGQFK
jgi:DNA-binding transcriptional LysR family regulator